MVRVITGTIIQVGLGELSVSEVEEMVKKEKRSAAGFTAPPHALFLVEVIYKQLEIAQPPRSRFVKAPT